MPRTSQKIPGNGAAAVIKFIAEDVRCTNLRGLKLRPAYDTRAES